MCGYGFESKTDVLPGFHSHRSKSVPCVSCHRRRQLLVVAQRPRCRRRPSRRSRRCRRASPTPGTPAAGHRECCRWRSVNSALKPAVARSVAPDGRREPVAAHTPAGISERAAQHGRDRDPHTGRLRAGLSGDVRRPRSIATSTVTYVARARGRGVVAVIRGRRDEPPLAPVRQNDRGRVLGVGGRSC